jgi:tetratricopeptide (TPR) repeat protein
VLAALAVVRSRWDEALRYIDRAIAAYPGDAERRFEMSLLAGDLCAKRMNDRVRAEKHYRAALALFPDHPGARKRLEAVLRGTRRPR